MFIALYILYFIIVIIFLYFVRKRLKYLSLRQVQNTGISQLSTSYRASLRGAIILGIILLVLQAFLFYYFNLYEYKSKRQLQDNTKTSIINSY